MSQLQFDENQNAGKTVHISLAGGVGLSFVWCPAGSFMMGTPSDSKVQTTYLEMPQHCVTLTKGYWIGQVPVTIRQWQVFMDSAPNFALDCPINLVRFDEVLTFCEKLTSVLCENGTLETNCVVTLPTEAQWEYACRAGTTTPWYFGDDVSLLTQHAWYRDTPHVKDVMPVGQKLPNPWGIYDLYGNVTEWCLDDLWRYPDEAQIDPIGMSNHQYQIKMMRGGDFYSVAEQCRSASRANCSSGNPMNEPVGIRVVCVEMNISQKP